MTGDDPAGPTISGITQLYVVIGDPVTQVRVPALMNPVLARLGVDAVLVPVQVSAPDLANVMRGLQGIGNLRGIFVTVPHKIAVRRFAERHSAAVELAGSANVLRREADGSWSADNFDGSGFVTGLLAAGHPVAGARVSLVGGGGAGSAVAAALLQAGVRELFIHDPDHVALGALLERLDGHWPGVARATEKPCLVDVDLAVNATPLGLRPEDPLPFSPQALPIHCVVADIIMKPRQTALLRAAVRSGRPVHHGAHMLDGQLASYREFFRIG